MARMPFVRDDGGRAAAGFKGTATGDCVARALAIVSGRPYADIYAALAAGNATQRRSKYEIRKGVKHSGRRSAAAGISTKRKWFTDYMASLGFTWVPTMQIGSGCKVHLVAGELPAGRLMVNVSKHYTAVIDGVVHDTYDPQRDPQDRVEPVKLGGGWQASRVVGQTGGRCVYGYWVAR
jgi:hypothetical protein